jgi:excisionase family DNA binding protein
LRLKAFLPDGLLGRHRHYLHHDTRDARKALDEHLRFEGLPPPASAAPVTFQAQSLETAKGEGRDIDGFPWDAAAFRWSGRQDSNLRPLGPEAASPLVDGLGPSGTGPDLLDNSEVGSDSPPDGVARNGPDRTESWAPVGRVAPLLGVERLLTVRQVAALLGVCRATVYAMVESGVLPHLRLGSLIRFRPEDLAAALARGGLPLLP